MSKKVTIKLYKSPNSCPKKQKETVKGLGLKKIGQERELIVSDPVMGMINKVNHLVKVVGYGS